MRRTAAILTAATLLAGGCADDEPAGTPPAPSGPLVIYERSGGVAGVLERLRVDRDGRAELIVGPEVDEHRVSFRLGAEELGRLEEQLAAADLEHQPEGPPGCADCFEYTLIYAGTTIHFDQLAEPSESVGALRAHLGEIVATHHPPS